MPETVLPSAFADARVLWEVLSDESGCTVFVVSRAGEVLQANPRALAWMSGRRALAKSERADQPYTLEDTCAPALYPERLAIVHRVCDEGVAIAYETISRSVRCLVTVHPIAMADRPGKAALVLLRRLRPWEKVTEREFPSATVIEIEKHDPGVLATLSPRELDVLILIGEGMPSSDIAKRLHRSVRTIERHRDRLGQKLGFTNRVDLARFAIRAGLAEMADWTDAVTLTKQPHDPLDISTPLRIISRKRIRKVD